MLLSHYWFSQTKIWCRIKDSLTLPECVYNEDLNLNNKALKIQRIDSLSSVFLSKMMFLCFSLNACVYFFSLLVRLFSLSPWCPIYTERFVNMERIFSIENMTVVDLWFLFPVMDNWCASLIDSRLALSKFVLHSWT